MEVKFGSGGGYCLRAFVVATLLLNAWRPSEAHSMRPSSYSSGYLPIVGPNMLRFQEEPVPKAAPPAMTNAAPSPVVSMPLPDVPKQKPVVIEAESSQHSALPVPDSIASTNQIGDIPLSNISGQNNEIVSPQMLLKYFNKGTNGASSSILAPLNGPTENPAAPLKSKATYTIGQ